MQALFSMLSRAHTDGTCLKRREWDRPGGRGATSGSAEGAWSMHAAWWPSALQLTGPDASTASTLTRFPEGVADRVQAHGCRLSETLPVSHGRRRRFTG
jgi:hypothetical protein